MQTNLASVHGECPPYIAGVWGLRLSTGTAIRLHLNKSSEWRLPIAGCRRRDKQCLQDWKRSARRTHGRDSLHAIRRLSVRRGSVRTSASDRQSPQGVRTWSMPRWRQLHTREGVSWHLVWAVLPPVSLSEDLQRR